MSHRGFTKTLLYFCRWRVELSLERTHYVHAFKKGFYIYSLSLRWRV